MEPDPRKVARHAATLVSEGATSATRGGGSRAPLFFGVLGITVAVGGLLLVIVARPWSASDPTVAVLIVQELPRATADASSVAPPTPPPSVAPPPSASSAAPSARLGAPPRCTCLSHNRALCLKPMPADCTCDLVSAERLCFQPSVMLDSGQWRCPEPQRIVPGARTRDACEGYAEWMGVAESRKPRAGVLSCSWCYGDVQRGSGPAGATCKGYEAGGTVVEGEWSCFER